MLLIREGRDFVVRLVNDGTLDTVIEVNDVEHRFDSEGVERNEDGSLPEVELIRLADDAIRDMCEEEFAAAKTHTNTVEEATQADCDSASSEELEAAAEVLHQIQQGSVKKLAKYLADYIQREEELRIGGINPEDTQELLEQGIGAFESTENVEVIVSIVQKDQADLRPFNVTFSELKSVQVFGVDKQDAEAIFRRRHRDGSIQQSEVEHHDLTVDEVEELDPK